MLVSRLALALLLAPAGLAAPASDLFARNSGSISSVEGGAVASEVAECSQIGIDILKQGGNAVDSMIAAGLCVGTVNAFHSGIGGGGFGIVRYNTDEADARGSKAKYEMIDFRETMPAAGNETMYASDKNGTTLSQIGGLAVGVPGEMRGWEALHNRHGKLPWTELFKGAIDLARNGFEVNVDLADAFKGYAFITQDPLWAESYAPNGTVLKVGDTCYRKRYANTLEKISWYGASFFYEGEMAVNTAYAAQARGGILTLADLKNYTALIRDTVNITYRDTRVFSTVAPSSGAVVLSALKIFEGFQGNYSETDPQINLTTSRLLESIHFAYGQRTQYADPAFVKNVTALQELYLTPAIVEELRAKIVDNETFPVGYYDPSNYTATRESGTSHLAVIDADGMAVSLTTTVNTFWGSRVMTPDGIVLNNEMDDFSSPGQVNAFGFAASPANYIRPGKRPLSSICGSIAEDLATGEIRVATGSAGGSRIITTTLQYLHSTIDQGFTAYQAAHKPRLHDQLSGVTFLEWKDESVGIAGFNNDTAQYLRDVGYNVTYQGTSGSTGHVVLRSRNGTLSAASDPRKRAGGGFAFGTSA